MCGAASIRLGGRVPGVWYARVGTKRPEARQFLGNFQLIAPINQTGDAAASAAVFEACEIGPQAQNALVAQTAAMTFTAPPYPPSPGLWRVGAAARMVGVSPRVLARACQLNVIPVTLVVLGERSRFVRIDEFEAWRKSFSDARTDENLF